MSRPYAFAVGTVVVLLALATTLGAWIALADRVEAGISVLTIWNTSLVLSASLALAIAATAAVVAQRAPGVAGCLAVVSICAAAPALERWSGSPSALSALAVAVAPLVVPALFSLSSVTRPRWRAARTAAWAVASAAAFVLLAFRDPFLDPLCAACGSSPFLIAAQPGFVLAARWLVAVIAVAAFVGGVVAALPVRVTSITVAPLSALPALAVLAVVLVSDASWASGAATRRPDAVVVWSASLLLVAGCHLVATIVIARRRAAVVAFADDLTTEASPRDDLTARLRAALRVPALRVAFPLEGGMLVDAEGRPAAPPAGTEVGTIVRSGDEAVACIVHPSYLAGDDLAAAFGPASGLALANARARAGIRATIVELQASRLRLVDAGDDIRRGIERDLHDGVQQTLLVLQYELALAASRADGSVRVELEAIRDEVQRLTARTRQLGHGLFPMSLDDVGLDAGLQRLADDAPVPFEPRVSLAGRPPRPVERTVYLVARDAVAAAVDAVQCEVETGRGSVIVTVSGIPPSAVTTVTRDRVDALGGTIDHSGSETKVVLPCGSS